MTPTIRLLIAGSRTVDPSDDEITEAASRLVMQAVFGLDAPLSPDRNLSDFIIEVVCGKADGADRAGERWAKARGIPVHYEPVTDADRQEHGPYLAPKMRNRRLADRATHGLLWWDCLSGGTPDMFARMHLRGKPARLFPHKRRPTRARAAKGSP